MSIESALLDSDMSFRAIARHFEISPDTLRRHARADVPGILRDDVLANRGLSLDFADRVRDIGDALSDIRRDAEERGDLRAAVAAARAEVDAQQVLADRFGVRSHETATAVEDARALAGALRLTAQTNPDALRVIATSLESLGRVAWAESMRAALNQMEREATAREVTTS